MSDENQIVIPPSFIALFTEPGRSKIRASRSAIAERYEFCEDLAHMLTDQARDKLWDLGIGESDVLRRIGQGLMRGDAGVDGAEAQWVLQRLAELLDWTDHLPAASG